MVYTRPDEFRTLEVTVVTLGNELPRVFIVLVPSLLHSVERTCVRVTLRLHIKDGVNGRVTSTDTGHDCILVGTDYGSDAIQHGFLLKERG